VESGEVWYVWKLESMEKDDQTRTFSLSSSHDARALHAFHIWATLFLCPPLSCYAVPPILLMRGADGWQW